ncbi:superoxide dismutase [Teichococcus oryzae]|uniref:superoxide dismutase n=1 Tax=Teichococcus oryzae TaxID=1608942 RepID=A0A5B2TKP9_9PROT|nr:superoxide dismutase [Pseudoroseomonas oryzae]
MNTTTLLARRFVLAAGASMATAGFAGMRVATAQSASPVAPAAAPAAGPATASGPFALPPLTYAPTALEPHIDAATMSLHHDRHHAAYVTALNGALKDHGQLAQLPLEQLLARLGEAPEAVRTTLRNNAGGHANHAMFWQIMGANAGGAPSGELAQAIDRDLGGLDKFKADFNGAGARQFGSGWVFVTVDRAGKLAIAARPNQDTPLMDGQRVLMGNDVWEHAYYLKYNNRRADYLAAWWNVVNWNAVAQRYAAAKDGSLTI